MPKLTTGDPQTKDGRYLKSWNGKQEICFTWNRKPDGCDSKGCPQKRAHVCEWCRKPHRAISCPEHPNWKPPQGKGQGGRGKGAGRT